MLGKKQTWWTNSSFLKSLLVVETPLFYYAGYRKSRWIWLRFFLLRGMGGNKSHNAGKKEESIIILSFPLPRAIWKWDLETKDKEQTKVVCQTIPPLWKWRFSAITRQKEPVMSNAATLLRTIKSSWRIVRVVKPSALLTVRILSTYGVCISLLHRSQSALLFLSSLVYRRVILYLPAH